MHEVITFDNFPDDNVKRVVWAFGEILKNNSAYSSNPKVQVGFVELLSNNKLGNKSIVIDITIGELDVVRLGTIWKNKECVGIYQNFVECYFSFDFSSSKINTINFFDKKPNTKNQYYIPPYKYDLALLKSNEEGVSYSNFYKSNLTHLYSTRGVNVFIPSLELFTSTYSDDKELRKKILTKEIYEVLDYYFDLTRCRELENVKYLVSFKNDNIKHIKSRIFLAYLRHNKKTNNRVSKIWADLSSNAYPRIEPYHPKAMELVTEGIWLDNNKRTFLVLRIKKHSLPTEYEVIPEIPESSKKAKKERSYYIKAHYNEVKIDRNKPLSSEVDPSKFQGTAYITTDVGIIGDIPESEVMIRQRDTKSCNHETLDSDATSLSSGDSRYGMENSQTAALESKALDDDKNIDVLNNTFDAYIKLIQNSHVFNYFDEETRVRNVICYDENGKQFENKYFAKFPYYLVGKKSINSWPFIPYKKLRKVLLCRVVLSNRASAFLLEIQRKGSESYKGLLFNTTTGSLTSDVIKELLLTVAQNKGKLTYGTPDPNNYLKTKYQEIEFPLSIVKAFAFKHGSKDKTYSRMITVIDEAIEKKLFEGHN